MAAKTMGIVVCPRMAVNVAVLGATMTATYRRTNALRPAVFDRYRLTVRNELAVELAETQNFIGVPANHVVSVVPTKKPFG